MRATNRHEYRRFDLRQRQWEIIEEISEHFPYIVIFVFPDTFVIESITLGDGPRFMIASQDGNSVFVSE